MDNTPESVWDLYQRGKDFNRFIGLYDRVKQNEDFYTGKQWEGLHAPDLDKPVVNILKRVVSYKISQIVSDDIKANFTAGGAPGADGETEILSDILSAEVENVFEANHMKSLCREAVRDAAVDGDSILYLWADTPKDGEAVIRAELLDNRNVLFGNPYSDDTKGQPYILIAQFLPAGDVRRMLPDKEMQELIKPDGGPGDTERGERDFSSDRRVTLLTKFWKEDGCVWFYRCTAGVEITKPTNTGQRIYPVAYMSWEKVKDCYHGQADITGLIPNQIFINKAYAMAMRQMQMTAFPKVFYDKTKVREWNNRVGEAIPIVGNPAEAVADSFRAADMSPQVFQLINQILTHTKEAMGASDAVLGNVRPDNTSAILAVQQASSAPLEMQKLAFYQFAEDAVRVMLDIMRAKYGVREVAATARMNNRETGRPEEFPATAVVDFSAIDIDALRLKLDVGAASYWSEIGQLSTMDNLFSLNLVTPKTYIEGLPQAFIKNKNRILADLEQEKSAAERSLTGEEPTPGRREIGRPG